MSWASSCTSSPRLHHRNVLMGFDTIAPGIVVASKVEEDRCVAKLVSIFCVSVQLDHGLGNSMVAAWLFQHFGGRGCGCASTRAVDDQALVGIGHTRTAPASFEGELAFTAMDLRDPFSIVRI